LLKNPRYAAALGTGSDVAAFARGLAHGGYATDPDYVQKLTAVAARLKSGNSLPLNITNAI
jgi:flagellar protein FlgJ